MNNYLRPDEKANYSEIERAQERDRHLKTGIKAAGTAAAFATGLPGRAASALSSKLLPLLNDYVPVDLALKGINKISPEIGKFLKGGMEKGLDIKEGLNFVKEKISPQEDKQEAPKTDRNIIQQYDPELHTYIEQAIKKGQTPVQAGLKAKGHERFKKAIDKMVKDHKTTWTDIIESVFGGMDKAQPTQQQPPALPQQSQQMQQQQQQQQQGQPGPGQQKLMQIMQMMMQKPGAPQ